MSNSLKTRVIKWAVTYIVGFASAGYYVFSRNIAEQELVEQYRILCDAFSLPGMFMIFIALLFTMNNLGALDSITYLLKYGIRSLIPGAFGEMEHYLDYVEARREKRIKGYGFLYWVGLMFIAIALVFLVLFYSVLQ